VETASQKIEQSEDGEQIIEQKPKIE